MTATSRKQGACFPAELWEQIQAKADADSTTPGKIVDKPYYLLRPK